MKIAELKQEQLSEVRGGSICVGSGSNSAVLYDVGCGGGVGAGPYVPPNTRPPAGGAGGEDILNALCYQPRSNEPVTSGGYSSGTGGLRLTDAEIRTYYSRSIFMDGHEIRNGDPYNRWPPP